MDIHKYTENAPYPTILPKHVDYLPDLLRLKLNSLPVDENTLTLVRLRLPPFPNLRRKLRHHLLVAALQQDTCGLGRACLDALWNTQLNRVRVSGLERDELLTGVLGLDSCRRGLDCSPVTDTD